MSLRNLLFAVIDIAFNTPRVVTLVVGAWGYAQGWLSLGQITTAVLYVEALSGPLDRLVGELDRLQVGATSTARLLGIAEVPPDREPGDARPDGPQLVGRDLRFAYRDGPRRPPRHRPRAAHRRAAGHRRPVGLGQVDPGPAAVRHQPAAHRLGHASAASTLVDLPLEVLRTEVALVTQEHHVFIGSVRDNIVLAREDSPDEAVWAALSAVGVARLGGAAAAGPRHPDRVGPAGADAGPGAAGRAGAADHRRPAHAGARRGDLADRPAHRADRSRAR